MTLLLHPTYFRSIPIVGKKIKEKFESLAEQVDPSTDESGGMTVAIRTLNEADKLEKLLKDIHRQEFNGPIEIIIVDNESTDHTKAIAKKFNAKVVTLSRSDFTYPKSMNMALDAASHNLVFLTVGHAELLSAKSLRAGFRQFEGKDSKVAGVFGHALPGANASNIENKIAMGNLFYTRNRDVTKSGLGTMAATGSIWRKSVWEKLGKFDERYERGGEDGAMAGKMLASGFVIKEEPLVSTHHTHGLNTIDTIKQWHEWTKLSQPTKLDKSRIQKRRPDLKLDLK